MSNILTPGLMPDSLTGMQAAFNAGDAPSKAAFQAAVSEVIVGSGLLAGYSDGFAIDATVSDKSRAVQIAERGIVTYAALEDVFPSVFASPKMTTQADGSLRWSNHNLFLYTDALSQATWFKVAITQADATASYIGDNSASTITASGTASYIQQTAPVAAYFPYRTVQWIVKAGTSSICYLEFNDGTPRRAYFNLSNGTLGTVDAGVTASISATLVGGAALPAGYYRIAASYRAPATSNPFVRLGPCNADGSVTTTSGKSLIVERPLLHYGLTPLPYLRNSGATPKFAAPFDYKYGESRLLCEVAAPATSLWSDDLTQAAWTKTNLTAALTATGPDGEPCSTLTATAADATALQSTADASTAQTFSIYIKRRTGTGAVYITANGGSTWTDVTAQIGASGYSRVVVHGVASPTIGIRLAVSGDAVDVSKAVNTNKAMLTSPVPVYSAIWTPGATILTLLKSRVPYAGAISVYCDSTVGDEKGADLSHQVSVISADKGKFSRLNHTSDGTLALRTYNGAAGTLNYVLVSKELIPGARISSSLSISDGIHCVSINGDPPVIVDAAPLPAWDQINIQAKETGDQSQIYLRRFVVAPGAVGADALRDWRWDGTHPYIVDCRIVTPIAQTPEVEICREPAVCILSDNGDWADFAVTHMQKRKVGFTIEAPARILQRNYRVWKKTGKIKALTESVVVATPALWDTGFGHLQSANIGKIPLGANAGKYVLMYTQLETPTFVNEQRDVYMRIGDGAPGGWGAAVKILSASQVSAPALVLAPGQSVITLPANHAVAPNRMVTLGYIANGCYGIYSDDGAATWNIGTRYFNAIPTNEPTLTLAADGSLTAFLRTETNGYRAWATSTDGGVNFVNQGQMNSALEFSSAAGSTQIDRAGAVSAKGVALLSRPDTVLRTGLSVSRVSGPGAKPWGSFYPWSAVRGSGYSSLAAVFGGSHALLASEAAGPDGGRSSVQVALIKL